MKPDDDTPPLSRKRPSAVLDDAYLPLNELAVYSGLSVRMLQEYLTHPAHPLPHYRFNSKIEVRRSEFDAWARQFRIAPAGVDFKALVEARIRGEKAG
jgi:hypothetical protein